MENKAKIQLYHCYVIIERLCRESPPSCALTGDWSNDIAPLICQLPWKPAVTQEVSDPRTQWTLNSL